MSFLIFFLQNEIVLIKHDLCSKNIQSYPTFFLILLLVFFEQFIMSILKVVILFLNYYLLICFTLPAVNLHDF